MVNKKPTISFEEAIKMGEYHPDFLSKYAGWEKMSPHVQLQHIRKGVDNRRRQLTEQWAELNNVLHFSEKPELKTALKGLEKQIKLLDKDQEDLYLFYTSKI